MRDRNFSGPSTEGSWKEGRWMSACSCEEKEAEEKRHDLFRNPWGSGNSRVAAFYSSPSTVRPSTAARPTRPGEIDGEALAHTCIMEWRANPAKPSWPPPRSHPEPLPFSQHQISHQVPASDPTHTLPWPLGGGQRVGAELSEETRLREWKETQRGRFSEGRGFNKRSGESGRGGESGRRVTFGQGGARQRAEGLRTLR